MTIPNYTPGTPPTRPLKQVRPTYLNTPEIDIYSKSLSAFEINSQHKNAASFFSVRGFNIIIKGMSIIISRGVCILKRGASIINYTHNNSKFFIDRPLPTQKTEVFYLAINRTNENNGDAVLFLFNRERDITNDWIVLKRLVLPINSNDLSSLQVLNAYPPESVNIYNYVLPQPDGSNNIIHLPFKIKQDSVCLTIDSKRYYDFSVTCDDSGASIILSDVILPGNKMLADFVMFI